MSSTPRLTLTTAAAAAVEATVMIVPVFDGDDLSSVPGLDGATGGELSRALGSGEFKGKPFEVSALRLEGWACRRLLAVGAGKRTEWTGDRLRKLATTGGLAARGRAAGTVALILGPADQTPHAVQAAAEGLVLAAYDGDVYKTVAREAAPLVEGQLVVVNADDSLARAAERGRVMGECSNLARTLSNEPGNRLTPREFAARAESVAADVGLDVTVLDERALASLGMGLLLGVGQGSVEPPRLIVLRHEPPGAPATPVLGLVGKGVTFDTGGISIKPAEGMEKMKGDMAGGAAVIAAMRAIRLLNAPLRVIGVVPAVENMPGGRAIKPGDVLVSASGKTVEVNNTDAEGRLILADALWYARQQGATHLVDVATLTGACVVALGRHVSGLFAVPAWWSSMVRDAAALAGDRLWPMPLDDDYLEQMKSDIADLVNTGGRAAGAITAAVFLKEFTSGLPWAHLDIAGTAWVDEAKPYQPKGAAGVAVRTLAELAFTAGRWPPA